MTNIIDKLFKKKYDGQTFCTRAMFTAFMSDASNIMTFSGEVDVQDTVGYSVELWVFKPEKSGKQVGITDPISKCYFCFIVCHGCHKDW